MSRPKALEHTDRLRLNHIHVPWEICQANGVGFHRAQDRVLRHVNFDGVLRHVDFDGGLRHVDFEPNGMRDALA